MIAIVVAPLSPAAVRAACLPPAAATTGAGFGEPPVNPAHVTPVDYASLPASRLPAAPLKLGSTVVVNTWFHVISDGLVVREPLDVQLDQQLAVLNEAFAGNDGSANTPFDFNLKGVTRTVDAAWASMKPGSKAEKDAKRALRRGGASTLNVYIARPQGSAIGWGTLPGGYASKPWYDGVVIHQDGLPLGTIVGRQLGYLAVHEVGHWLGLLHPFEGGCLNLDYVHDTPAQASPAYGCDPDRDTCPAPGQDPIHNFMNYSDDYCMSNFTPGQAGRMIQEWARYRA